jgi:chemotaxis signal transduction protein
VTASDQRVQLLLFRLGQTRFAVLASQIQALRGHDGTGPARWLHDLLGFAEPPRYREPTEALVSGTWIVLDAMEELLDLPLEAIRPFPELVEPFSLRRGLWGILPNQGCLVFLADLQQMLNLYTIPAPDPVAVFNLV